MSHTTSRHAATHHVGETDLTKKSWALLAVALAAQILVVLDISVVNTALPSIGRALHLEGGQLQWLVTAYLMMSGGCLLLGGRISDLLSRRRVFLTGLTLFTVASLASAIRREQQPAHRRPRRSRTQRRTAHPLRALPDHDHLRRNPAKDRTRHLGCCGQPGCCGGSPPRRRPDHVGQLARHLLDQRPHRCRGAAHRTPGHRQGHHTATKCPRLRLPRRLPPSSVVSPPSSTESTALPRTAGPRCTRPSHWPSQLSSWVPSWDSSSARPGRCSRHTSGSYEHSSPAPLSCSA